MSTLYGCLPTYEIFAAGSRERSSGRCERCLLAHECLYGLTWCGVIAQRHFQSVDGFAFQTYILRVSDFLAGIRSAGFGYLSLTVNAVGERLGDGIAGKLLRRHRERYVDFQCSVGVGDDGEIFGRFGSAYHTAACDGGLLQ